MQHLCYHDNSSFTFYNEAMDHFTIFLIPLFVHNFRLGVKLTNSSIMIKFQENVNDKIFSYYKYKISHIHDKSLAKSISYIKGFLSHTKYILINHD